MKCKKLISALLAIAMVFSCIPAITASADAEDAKTRETAASINLNEEYFYYWEDNTQYGTYFGYQEIWVKFTVPSNGMVQFNGQRLFDRDGNLYNFEFQLYDSLGATDPFWDAYYTRFTSTNYRANIPLKAGTYYFCAEVRVGDLHRERLDWYFRFDFTARNDYELEPNNTKATAQALTYNKRVNGVISNDDDFYKVTVSKDTPALIKIGNLAALDANGVYTKIHYANGDSRYISLSSTGNTDADDYAQASGDHYYFEVLLKKGTNYIEFAEFTDADINYWIEVTNKIPTVKTPPIKNLKISGSTVEILWTQVSGVDGYEVWRKVNSGKWEMVGDYGSNYYGIQQFYTDFSDAYQFRVRAVNKFGPYGKEVKYYSGWSKVKALIPTPTNIKLSTTTYTYNGKAKKPSVTIKDATGRKLKEGTDYTLKYASGRKKIGKYKVTIKFKGNYSGTKTKYFTIAPKKTSVSKVTAAKKALTVKIKKQTKNTSGYEIQYSTSSKFKSGNKTVDVKKNSTTSVKIKKLKAKKNYYVRVRTYKKINGKKYCSEWSKAVKKKTK